MKRRLVSLRREEPLLDIVSYGRGGVRLTPAQRAEISRTIRRIPEVMVKVSGGARTLAGVERHLKYISRDGNRSMETDDGERNGKHMEQQLARDWDLDLEAYARQTERSIRGRRLPKLVHNLIFSMPPGTSPDKVMKAVRTLVVNEFALKHRYAMVLHTDDNHPHVHVVVKAVSEQGVRLNIRKATLRQWRKQFALNLRDLGVAANATERAVRGQTVSRHSDPIYRAHQRAASTFVRERDAKIIQDMATNPSLAHPGSASLRTTRNHIVAGWRAVADKLADEGQSDMATQVHRFVDQMAPPLSDREIRAAELRNEGVPKDFPPPHKTR